MDGVLRGHRAVPTSSIPAVMGLLTHPLKCSFSMTSNRERGWKRRQTGEGDRSQRRRDWGAVSGCDVNVATNAHHTLGDGCTHVVHVLEERVKAEGPSHLARVRI